MSYEMLILLFFVFLLVSAIFSMLGQGGGAFYVPMLLAVSVPFYVAAATSQVFIMAVSLFSMLIFAKAPMLDWKLVLLIEPPPIWEPSLAVTCPITSHRMLPNCVLPGCC